VSVARPAAFLDRDGVLNIDHGYVHQLDQLDIVARASEAVRVLNEAGYLVIVITNQSGVARGLYGEEDVRRFNDELARRLDLDRARIDAFYYCPHHPSGSVAAYAISCDCRKPKPGLLQRAAKDFAIDRSRSFLIGDKDSDIEAAAAFGIKAARFDGNRQSLVDVVRSMLRDAGAGASHTQPR
jgi:D-glycero-D-manno-heptose 1,7-bisphosphate phosphatase